MDYKYNPFGDNHSTYQRGTAPAAVSRKKSKKSVVIAKIVASIVAISLILTVVVCYSSVSKWNKEAEDAMTKFNSANQTLHLNITGSDFRSQYSENIKQLREIKTDNGLKKREIDKQIKASQAVLGVSSTLKEQPKEITKDMSETEATNIVLPYYTVCDLVGVASPKHEEDGRINIKSMCEGYGQTAKEMMEKTLRAKKAMDSPMGWFYFGDTQSYPVLTKQ